MQEISQTFTFEGAAPADRLGTKTAQQMGDIAITNTDLGIINYDPEVVISDPDDEIVVQLTQPETTGSSDIQTAPEPGLGDIDITLTGGAGESLDHLLVSSEPEDRRAFFDIQRDRVRDAYPKGREVQTPIVMLNHAMQEHDLTKPESSGERMSTCVVASAGNSLRALGIYNESTDSESAMLLEIGGQAAFSGDGLQDMNTVINKILQKRNVYQYATVNFDEMMRNLEGGGVAVIGYREHARLISGANTENGEIVLTVNDPFARVATKVPLTQMIDAIEKSSDPYLITNISRSV